MVHVQKQNHVFDITTSVLAGFYEGSSCDIIIKTGPEKFEKRCHKIVVASSSDFLSTVISSAEPGTTPVLLLPDIKSSVLDFLLLYIYTGEINIPSELYPDFVDACILLEIKGDFSYDTHHLQRVEPPTTSLNHMKLEPGQIVDGIEHEFYDDIDESMIVRDPFPEDTINKTVRCDTRSDSVLVEPKELQRKFQKSVKNVYVILGIEITDVIEARIKNSELIIENGKLLRGSTVCGLCDADVAVNFQIKSMSGTVIWLNTNMRNHMSRKHSMEKKKM